MKVFTLLIVRGPLTILTSFLYNDCKFIIPLKGVFVISGAKRDLLKNSKSVENQHYLYEVKHFS